MVARKGYSPSRVAPAPVISTREPSALKRMTGKPLALGWVTGKPGSL